MAGSEPENKETVFTTGQSNKQARIIQGRYDVPVLQMTLTSSE